MGHGSQAGTSDSRYHHLDALRAFALLLGVLFHAAESFGPRNTYWATVDASPSEFLECVRFACHSFRMEIFFVIAGFFARLLILKRGVRGFAGNRAVRILVPLVCGWVVLFPLMVSLWLWGAGQAGRLGEMGVPPEVQNFPAWKLALGFMISGQFVKKFDLTHLWFLHQLAVLYLILLGVLWGARRLPRFKTWLLPLLDRLFNRVCEGSWGMLAFVLPTIPMLLLMNDWGVDTPKSSLLPHPPTTLLYGFCFLIGWLLHRQPALLHHVERRWTVHMGVGVLFWVMGIVFLAQQPWKRTPHEYMLYLRTGFLTLYATMMWGFVMGFTGLFTRFFQRPRPVIRYIADASYWIYLAHLPVVVSLQIMVSSLHYPWPLKYGFILAIAMPVLIITYHFLVRGTFLGVVLNGRRHPLNWPWQPVTVPPAKPPEVRSTPA